LFANNYPWPSSHSGKLKTLVHIYLYLFWIFILIPALFYLMINIRKLFNRNDELQPALLLILPIIGLMAVVFFNTGNTRYRIAYDGFFILLAAGFYTYYGNWIKYFIGFKTWMRKRRSSDVREKQLEAKIRRDYGHLE
jgi:hypothetical membrane protein